MRLLRSSLRLVSLLVLMAAFQLAPGPAVASGNYMTLVGALNPWLNGQFSNVAADASRGVAYLGSFDDQGVAVIDTSNPTKPELTEVLSTHITSSSFTSDSADLDLVGRYLAVSHQPWFDDPSDPKSFTGVSVYDTQADPLHPVLLRRIPIEGGVHTVQLDPEVASGRPYIYGNSGHNLKVTIANILTGDILGEYASSEGVGEAGGGFNFAHEGHIQRHADSNKVLDYVSYWDSGLRIVDVTDPANPVEVGAFDYNPEAGTCCAHDAKPTPSGDWVYLEDEIGFGGTGGVRIQNTSSCDGTSYCTPTKAGFWHINGHPVQAAAIHGRGFGAIFGIIQRFFTFDAHNIDVQGEDTLLVANYSMGIRLIDTSDKSNPVETSFFLPNSGRKEACKIRCFFQGRETWGAYFGSDGRIYASDFWLGLFIVRPPD